MLILYLFSSTCPGWLPGRSWGGSMGAAWGDRPRGQRGQTPHPRDRHWQGKPSTHQSSKSINPSVSQSVFSYPKFSELSQGFLSWIKHCVGVKTPEVTTLKLMMSIFFLSLHPNPTWMTWLDTRMRRSPKRKFWPTGTCLLAAKQPITGKIWQRDTTSCEEHAQCCEGQMF